MTQKSTRKSKVKHSRARRVASTTRSIHRSKSAHPVKSAKWSAAVMKSSDAMDLTSGVFKLKSARAVAQSLKRSAEASQRRKSTPFRSAMSMLNFEINRGGTNLSAERRRVLNQAKDELRKLYRRTVGCRSRRT